MTILDDYKSRLAEGEIEADPAQRDIVRRLDALQRALEDRSAAPPGSILKRFFSARPSSEPAPTRGLYIHGGVGRGKTMLMDLFFDGVAFAPKQRAHFHEFMADVHDRIA
ncbi:MAG: AFG1/ZapE family ATPase, partial [Myxococcaceae bacterium]|nr:AFG1/ZapE family ATPase [Myxococcaceae bacterium]